MNKIELLSPAGDLEKLKCAILFGADAVYIGGKEFSLRSMASNFTLEDIKEGCAFAHLHHAKIYVTCNIVMHESDLTHLKEYLLALQNCGVDAVIASSFTIIKLVKELTNMEAHVSTQQSVCNSMGVNFFKELGADRVVLARECTLENIKQICRTVDTDLEVFIEGGMCASVSGRCMLSNVMTNRDANRGGCAQSCRWNYDIYKENNKVSIGDYDFTMSSKDLNVMRYIPELIKAGVKSLKIEGRMKSLHYIATIVSAYRKCIDEYYNKGHVDNINKYIEWISKGENRPVSHGFLLGDVTENEEIYNDGFMEPSHDFVGIVLDYNPLTHLVTIEQRNYFKGYSKIEFLTQKNGPIIADIKDLYDNDNNLINAANHAQMIVKFYSDVFCEANDLVRLINQ